MPSKTRLIGLGADYIVVWRIKINDLILLRQLVLHYDAQFYYLPTELSKHCAAFGDLRSNYIHTRLWL